MRASRRSHSTVSYGCSPAVVKCRRIPMPSCCGAIAISGSPLSDPPGPIGDGSVVSPTAQGVQPQYLVVWTNPDARWRSITAPELHPCQRNRSRVGAGQSAFAQLVSGALGLGRLLEAPAQFAAREIALELSDLALEVGQIFEA